MSKSYYQKLKSPKWQKKRLEILQRDDFQCVLCDNEGEEQLHIHHIVYRKGCDPWDYNNKDLITLCESCHKCEHDYIDTLKDSIVEYFWQTGCSLDMAQVLYLIRGINELQGTNKTIEMLQCITMNLKEKKELTDGVS